MNPRCLRHRRFTREKKWILIGKIATFAKSEMNEAWKLEFYSFLNVWNLLVIKWYSRRREKKKICCLFICQKDSILLAFIHSYLICFLASNPPEMENSTAVMLKMEKKFNNMEMCEKKELRKCSKWKRVQFIVLIAFKWQLAVIVFFFFCWSWIDFFYFQRCINYNEHPFTELCFLFIIHCRHLWKQLWVRNDADSYFTKYLYESSVCHR